MADVLEQPLTSDSLYECICSLSSPSHATDFEKSLGNSWHHVVGQESLGGAIDLEPVVLA